MNFYMSKRRPSRASRYSAKRSERPGMSDPCTSSKLGVRPCFSRNKSLHGLSWRRRHMYLRKCSASRTRRRELRPRRHGMISWGCAAGTGRVKRSRRDCGRDGATRRDGGSELADLELGRVCTAASSAGCGRGALGVGRVFTAAPMVGGRAFGCVAGDRVGEREGLWRRIERFGEENAATGTGFGR